MLKYRYLFNLIGFKLTWVSCIMGEIYYGSLLGLFVGVTYLTFFFIFQNERIKCFYIILIFSVLGYSFDSFLSFFEIYKINSDITFLFLPIWFIVLWPSFSTLLVDLFSFLEKKTIIATLLGAFFGPLSYYAGVSLGLVTYTSITPFIIISLYWSLMMYSYSNFFAKKKYFN